MRDTKLIKQKIDELMALIGHTKGAVGVSNYTGGSVFLDLHDCGDYEAGTALLRDFGIGQRSKRIIENTWHILDGNVDGIHITAYCKGLPTSCRLITEYVKVPKTQVVESGEFVEVPTTRAVCGKGEE